MSFSLSCLLTSRRIGTVGLLALATPGLAQQPSNDGFRRHNGQMEVVRNGQPRPLTRAAHLPTGATVTPDGFVVDPTGQRTELREGQGCDLRGRPVAVRATAGGLVLASPGHASRAKDDEDDGPAAPKRKKHKPRRGRGRGRGPGHDD